MSGDQAGGDGGPVRVTAGARVHFGFRNLSLARERLYGGLGAALSAPRAVVEARPADGVEAPPVVADAVARSVASLGVEGASVSVPERIPRHVGLGSGTVHALAAHAAVAAAHGLDPEVRAAAPELGRGGRSGVGVAAFEAGGVVADAGHPTARFTADPPADGEWTVPPVLARHDAPGDWRVVLVRPAVDRGRSGDAEDRTMREVVERADPAVADEVGRGLLERLRPAAAEGDQATFGAAVGEVSRLNGAWYADEQGGVFRPPVGAVVGELRDSEAVAGAGQSSWGPTAFGIARAADADRARAAGRDGLSAAGVDGTVDVVALRNEGARIEPL